MKKGFTLIELLVVVLIIGILSSVALPQYQKVVLKARTTQAIITLRALETAQTEYFMANGSYTENLEDLTLEIDENAHETLSCVDEQKDGGYVFCQVRGKKGITMEWVISQKKLEFPARRCLAAVSNATANSVCKSYGGTLFRENGNGFNYYSMP